MTIRTPLVRGRNERSRLVACLIPAMALALACGSALATSSPPWWKALPSPQPGVREYSGQVVVKPRAGERVEPASIVPGSEVVAFIEQTGEWILKTPAGMTDGVMTVRLASSGVFEYVEPDWIVYPQGFPDDPLFGSQWHHSRILTPSAWPIWTGAPAVVVAVVDSGIDLSHPDLSSVLVGGYNAVSKLAQWEGGDVSDVSNAGHGTAVAGCIGAVGNNGYGVAGVGWKLRVMPVRATNETSGSAVLSNVLAGCRWASENGARVVNASYAGVSSSSVQSTGAYIRNRGGILVWAAGNSGQFLSSSVDWPDVVIVGAVDSQDARPSWGNYGPALDLVAPGVGIVTTGKGGGSSTHNGTSFSSPLVAGVIGLAWSVGPSMDRAAILEDLAGSCDDIGPYGEDDLFGLGVVDAREMVLRAWRRTHVFEAPLTSLDEEGPLSIELWPVRPVSAVKPVLFGRDLNALAVAMFDGERLESSTIDLGGLDPGRTQLRLSTFQSSWGELVIEYLNEDGVWMLLIEPASTIEGPIDHTWDLPPESVHPRFAVRITCLSPGEDPIYVSAMSIATRCMADFDNSGFVDIDDYTSFVSAFEAGSLLADFDGSGFVDTDDFTAFILSFDAGC